MEFGPIPVSAAVGAYLAHATDAGSARFRKGKRLTAEDVAALTAAGVGTVIAAVLSADDVGEDEAAARIATALVVDGVEIRPAATGRVNIHARHSGVFEVNRPVIAALNSIDPGITIATLAKFVRVQASQMVATVKIIPFGIGKPLVGEAEAIASRGRAFAVHRFAPARVGLVQTILPGIKSGVLDKTVRVTAERFDRSGSVITREIRCPHDEAAVASAISALKQDNDIVVAFGASAMTDPGDVIPEAIRRAGGTVERAGMPVDPGNLLVLGKVDGKVVIGAPGCARSAKENGFDWVLDRILAGIPPGASDIAAMGVGGLLMEIPSRPSPRESRPPSVVAVVLAAGKSSRMGGSNKLLADFGGVPLVRRTVERVVAGKVTRTVVVTGHMAEHVEAALEGCEVELVRNLSYADGLSSSLKSGVAAAGLADGVLVVLADMPALQTTHIDRLIAAFTTHREAVIRAAYQGKGGNPVVLPRKLFGAIATLQGDSGAKQLLGAPGLDVIEVETGDAALIDVDTPEQLAAAQESVPGVPASSQITG